MMIQLNVIFQFINISMLTSQPENPFTNKLENYLSRLFLELGKEWNQQKRQALKKALSQEITKHNNLQPYLTSIQLKQQEVKFALLYKQACEQHQVISKKHSEYKELVEKQNKQKSEMQKKIVIIEEHQRQLKQYKQMCEESNKLSGILSDLSESNTKQNSKLSSQRISLDTAKKLETMKITVEQKKIQAHQTNINNIKEEIESYTQRIRELTTEKRQLEKQLRKKDQENLKKSISTGINKRDQKTPPPNNEEHRHEKPKYIEESIQKKRNSKQIISSQAKQSFSKKAHRYGFILTVFAIVVLYLIMF